MTSQEQTMISGLIDRVNQTQLPEKDAEAEALLQQGLGRNPDALYILAQTLLVQKYALEQAQKQLLDAKAELAQAQVQAQAQPKPHTSFLGGLLGTDRPAPPPPPPPPAAGYAPVYTGPQGGYGAPEPGYGQPMYAQPGYGAPSGGGFLQTAMTTAAGVVAGEAVFQGIEGLMHGFEHHGGYEERGFGGFGGAGGMGVGGGDDYRAFEQHGGGERVEREDDGGMSADTGGYDGDTSSDSSDFSDDGGSDDSGGFGSDDGN